MPHGAGSIWHTSESLSRAPLEKERATGRLSIAPKDANTDQERISKKPPVLGATNLIEKKHESLAGD